MRILIFEDEYPAAERLQKLLSDIDSDIQIVGVYDTVETAIKVLSDHANMDLIITDVELADGLCFGIFKEVDIEVPVVFTTAYNQYAIRAFETNAVDYLLKPVKVNELKLALEKAEKRISKKGAEIDYSALAQSMLQQKSKSSKRYMIRYGNKMMTVKSTEAAYFYSMQKSTFLVNANGKPLPIDESLNQVEKELDAELFYRINRNLVVNIESIKSVDMLGKGRMRINLHHPPEDKQFLLVSADRSPEFRKWLQGTEKD